MRTVRKGLRKIGSVFRRSQKKYERSSSIAEDVQSPHDNIRSVNASKGVGVKFVMDDDIAGFPTGKIQVEGGSTEVSGCGTESPAKRDVKDMAKNAFKHAEKSARSLKHVLSGKTRKSKDDSVATLQERENESDSSDDEFLSPPIDVIRTPVYSQAIAPKSGSPKSNLTEVYSVPSNTKPEKACSPERPNEEMVKSGENEEMVADKRVVSSFTEVKNV